MVAAGDPVYASDINDLISDSSQKPLVRLVQSVAQSIPDNTATAVTFSTDDIDTHNFHSTSSLTDRITPTKAGYYRVTATLAHAARADIATVRVECAKNGTAVAPSCRQPYPSSVSPNAVPTYQTTAIMSANGTTDYFNMLVLIDNTANTATNTSAGGSTSSTLECEFLRDL